MPSEMLFKPCIPHIFVESIGYPWISCISYHNFGELHFSKNTIAISYHWEYWDALQFCISVAPARKGSLLLWRGTIPGGTKEFNPDCFMLNCKSIPTSRVTSPLQLQTEIRNLQVSKTYKKASKSLQSPTCFSLTSSRKCQTLESVMKLCLSWSFSKVENTTQNSSKLRPNKNGEIQGEFRD